MNVMRVSARVTSGRTTSVVQVESGEHARQLVKEYGRDNVRFTHQNGDKLTLQQAIQVLSGMGY